MTRMFGVLLSFLSLTVVSTVVEAGHAPGDVIRSEEYPYSNVKKYVIDHNIEINQVYKSHQCSLDGLDKAGAKYWCDEFIARGGHAIWIIVFSRHDNYNSYAHNITLTPKRLLRVSNNKLAGIVQFKENGAILSDTTGTISPTSPQEVKQERPESTKSAEEKTPQIDPADVAKKALGAIFKGW